MSNSNNFPLSFIETYLKKDMKNDLKQFYAQFENELFGERIKSIDRENHIVQFMKDEYSLGESDFEEVTFELSIKAKLDKELIKAKRLIELEFKNCFIDNKDANRYGDFLMVKLGILKKISAARDFPVLNNFLMEIEDTIKLFRTTPRLNRDIYSFNFIADNSSTQKEKVIRLYELLIIDGPLILCTKEEFISAFTGQTVEDGIDWLITGKSKMTSKVSLFYFVEQLIDKKFISRDVINDLNKYVHYVFRDCKGEELKNLKQSKATTSKKTSQKERIDAIISSL